MSDSFLGGNWNYPTSISAGAGRITELAQSCMELGMRVPLLVTDPLLAEMSMVVNAVQQCRDAGLNCRVFSSIKGNPTGENVIDGVAAFVSGGHDGVIAFGGGSALDAGKTVAVVAGQHRDLWDFEDSGDNWMRIREELIAPVVAVPTTAGTGSEVGRAAVITDTERELKRIIFHPRMLPASVILDPELTLELPATLTAATGMDALSHNLEALCSPGYHPMADGIALEGIRLVKDYLPMAVAQGGNLEARMQMQVASAMGATAFQKGLGAMHALAHSLGALYDAHHGLLNAILMPYVLRANRSEVEMRITRAAASIGLAEHSFDGFMAWVLELRRDIGIPETLADIGIDERRREQVGLMAAADATAAGNPIAFGAEQYSELFQRAVLGRAG